MILGIETSCDETAAAVVKDGKHILSNVILSQVDIHKEYGGVVPEIASRQHVEHIMHVINQALDKAGVTLDDIDAIAVTQGPGLVGALMVGLSAAKGLALAKNKKLIGVNHIEAHLYANVMADNNLEYPFIGLIVSGGHTSLVYVEKLGKYEILGHTIDDAAGESFDKVAKVLGLSYPGGPIIDKISKNGNNSAVKFPRPCMNDGTFKFSFSGLKTAVLYHVNKEKEKQDLSEQQVNDIAASFQEAAVDVLISKTMQASEFKDTKHIAVGGGVSLNSRLRERFKREVEDRHVDVHFPPAAMCIDNAAMIAGLGYEKFERGMFAEFSLDVDPGLALVDWFF